MECCLVFLISQTLEIEGQSWKSEWNWIPFVLCSESLEIFPFRGKFNFDAMHDFLDGVVLFMIKLFLRQLYSCGTTKISATEINRRILLFHFSFYDLSNKPSPKFTDAGIRKEGDYLTKQRASQNWCLIRMFPLLVGDLINEDNEYYIHFLQLLNILNILFSPKILTHFLS